MQIIQKPKKVPNQPCNDAEFSFANIEEQRQSLKLRPYQMKNLAMSLGQERFGDLSEAGTGKSPTAALWIYQRQKEGRVIWTMPKSLLIKNYFELLLWSNLSPDQVIIIDGTRKQRAQQLANKNTRVFLMGFTGFGNNWEMIRDAFPDTLTLCSDEHHLGFSTHCAWNSFFKRFDGSMRTYEYYRFLKRGGPHLAMTGTLIDGRLNSAFPLINVINPNYYPTYQNFMVWHAMCDEWGTPFAWKNHDRLKAILGKHSARTTFEEAYGAEKKLIYIQMCTMSTKQYRMYKEIEERGITELDEGFLEAANKGVALAKCIDIMQCPEKYNIKPHETDSKETHLKTILEDHKSSGKPLVLFETAVSNHKKLRDVAVKVGMTADIINGSVTTRRGDIDKLFREGKLQVLVCSPRVAGVGFNWPHVDHVVFCSLDWQDSTFIQNYRRAMRGVRDTALRITVLVYRKGMDIYISKKLKAKAADRLKVEDGVDVDLINKIIEASGK